MQITELAPKLAQASTTPRTRICTRALPPLLMISLCSSFVIHFGFSSPRFDICTLALPFTFSLLIPGSTHPRHPPFVIRSLVLLYTARLYSRTHRLALSLPYLVCRYFAVFSLSSNIDFDTSRVLRPSRSLTRLGSCKGRTTASKALLRL